jgi:Transcriptional regulator/sugar kinase
MATISLLLEHTNYMAKTTLDQTFVRKINLSSVLRLIHTQSPISRAQIAVHTGLNKSTVSSRVDELLAQNLIWETYANQYSIIQRVQARLEVKRSTVIPKLMAEQDAPLSIALIKQAANSGDAEAIDSLVEAGHAMGKGFAGLINIFNPEKIILGRPLSVVGEYLLPAIKETIAHHSFLPEINQQAEVVLSPFGPDASWIGAIAIVVDDVLSRPMNLGSR